MNGAVTAKRINKIDMTNIAVPASPPITFKVESPFVDKYKKARNIISEITATICTDIVFTIFPFPWTAQPPAIRIA